MKIWSKCEENDISTGIIEKKHSFEQFGFCGNVKNVN